MRTVQNKRFTSRPLSYAAVLILNVLSSPPPSNSFLFNAAWSASQSNKKNLSFFTLGNFTCKQLSVLAYRSEVGWKPVNDIEKRCLRTEHDKRLSDKGSSVFKANRQLLMQGYQPQCLCQLIVGTRRE